MTAVQEIGQVLRQLRGNQSQKALADAMRAKGHAWSQATVWSVETGARPLRLTEARDLADHWQVTVRQLLPERAPLVRLLGRNDLRVAGPAYDPCFMPLGHGELCCLPGTHTGACIAKPATYPPTVAVVVLR